MTDIIRLDAATLAAKIAAKEVSSTEVTQAYLDQIAATDSGTTRSCTSPPTRRWRPRPPSTSAGRRRTAAVAAGRGAAGAQGRVHQRRHAHHLRVEDPRGLAFAVRRHGDRAAARGGHPDPRQDQHGRVRDGLVDGELRLRPDPQPVEHRPGAGRFRRWQRRRARRVPGAAGHRHRHRRLDPPARRADRDGRGQTHLRHGVALRTGGLRVVAGPGRTVRAQRCSTPRCCTR